MDRMIVQKLLAIVNLGAAWVLWLLIALSVISVGIMIERGAFFLGRRLPDREALAGWLLGGSLAKARAAVAERERDRGRGGARGAGPGRPRRRQRGQGGRRRDQEVAARVRVAAGVSRHAGEQRAVHRPVRHGAGDHPRLRRSGQEPQRGRRQLGHGRNLRGADRHRGRPAGRAAGGRGLQHLPARAAPGLAARPLLRRSAGGAPARAATSRARRPRWPRSPTATRTAKKAG